MAKQQIGVIGMAVMGRNLALNIESRGFTVSIYNRSREKTDEVMQEAAGKNLHPTYTIEEFVNSLEVPRKILIMVQAGAGTDATIDALVPLLDEGDIIIDGGNAYFPDTQRRSKELEARGFRFIGTGVSGGEEGALKGPSIMPGGQESAYKLVEPILTAISAKVGGDACCTYIGPDGAGHYVKMVHNGIECGVMAAYAEGFGVLSKANVGNHAHEIDAETTPLRDPEHYQYDLDLRDIAEVWRRGSVIASWLLDLSAAALAKDPALASFSGRVSDSGEGRWTIKAAIDEAVPVPVLSTALYERFSSRGEAEFQDKLLSAMRFQFGGHLEKPAA